MALLFLPPIPLLCQQSSSHNSTAASYFNSQCGRMLKISCCATCIDNTRSTGSVSFAVAAYPLKFCFFLKVAFAWHV